MCAIRAERPHTEMVSDDDLEEDSFSDIKEYFKDSDWTCMPEVEKIAYRNIKNRYLYMETGNSELKCVQYMLLSNLIIHSYILFFSLHLVSPMPMPDFMKPRGSKTQPKSKAQNSAKKSTEAATSKLRLHEFVFSSLHIKHFTP